MPTLLPSVPFSKPSELIASFQPAQDVMEPGVPPVKVGVPTIVFAVLKPHCELVWQRLLTNVQVVALQVEGLPPVPRMMLFWPTSPVVSDTPLPFVPHIARPRL